MLRASSQATGEEADLGATVGRGDGDGGVEHGEALLRFTEAITKDSEDADPARQALQAVLSPEAFLEAAAIVAIFNGLVRTADAIGIPLDESTLAASNDFLGELGLDEYASAAHTPIEATGG